MMFGFSSSYEIYLLTIPNHAPRRKKLFFNLLHFSNLAQRRTKVCNIFAKDVKVTMLAL